MGQDMDWRALLAPDIQDFISIHKDSDVRDLAFTKMPDFCGHRALVLDQIKARQKAKRKTPEFYKTIRFVFPSSDVFEQASSEACARYKSGLFQGGRCIDLTGGCGVDAIILSRHFDRTAVVERDLMSAEILRHNADVLGANIEVFHDDATTYLEHMPQADLVYIDPQRRAGGKAGRFDFSMCSPDVLGMLDVLKGKTEKLMIKASPFLDIDKGINDLGYVSAVHVVEWDGQCKEVLYVLSFEQRYAPEDVLITAVQIDDMGVVTAQLRFTRAQERAARIEYGQADGYIFEASPAFQKAGAFRLLGGRYGLKSLHPHTHLYYGAQAISDFPGKFYEIEDVLLPKASALAYSGIKSADLAVRNYPASVADLRKKLKLKDGGRHRIYAVTNQHNEKRLIVCRKH